MPRTSWLAVAVPVAVAVGWSVWGVREYARTTRVQWLWMVVVMDAGVVGMLVAGRR